MKKKDLLKVALLTATIWLAHSAPAKSQAPSQDQTQTKDQGGTQIQRQDSFAYSAPLDTISRAGFYRIILTPDVLAKCKRDLSDIRIVHAGAWPDGLENLHGTAFIPYVLKTDFAAYNGASFIECPILPAQKEDSVGDIRIGNWSGGAVGSLSLYIHSAGVERNVTLSGSNDGKKWFVIKEHIRLFPLWTDESYMVQTIDFPKSNYRYFKFIQEDKGVLPIDIFRAGIVTQHAAGSMRYRPIPSPAIVQKDSSNHHSYITLGFPEPYMVENMKLYIKTPKLYKRRMLIKEGPADINPIELDLDPANTSIDLVSSLKGKIIVLDIDNQDNAPLVLDKVEASQKERYLLTWLEPGRYELLAGDKHATIPKYDLKYFIDTVSQEPAALIPGPLASVNFHSQTPIKPSRDYKGAYLWAAIVAVLLLLIWLCLNMLKSIRESRR